jgi:hypothetical protein
MDVGSRVEHQMSNSAASAALTSGAGRLVYDTDCFSTVSRTAALGASWPFGVLELKSWFPPLNRPAHRVPNVRFYPLACAKRLAANTDAAGVFGPIE